MRDDRPPEATIRDRARDLRRDATHAEKRLWHALRGRLLDGLRFARQVPIGPFIADFVCREARLVVEVDGGQHADNAHDVDRDAYLARAGYVVLRFWNNEIEEALDHVCGRIAETARRRIDDGIRPSRRPSPSRR